MEYPSHFISVTSLVCNSEDESYYVNGITLSRNYVILAVTIGLTFVL